VEFGNARYQDTIDRFIAGQPVADADLRAAWRNTTQSPRQTWDAPVYEQFYRTVHAVNRARPAGRQIRVLLGDPPIDWAAVTDGSGIGAFLAQRTAHAASVVEQQVLAKGHRALLCYGAAHLVHPGLSLRMPPSLASIIEQRTGERMYTIGDLVPSAADPAAWPASSPACLQLPDNREPGRAGAAASAQVGSRHGGRCCPVTTVIAQHNQMASVAVADRLTVHADTLQTDRRQRVLLDWSGSRERIACGAGDLLRPRLTAAAQPRSAWIRAWAACPGRGSGRFL